MEPHAVAGPSSTAAVPDADDSALSKSKYLTRQEVMKRRASRLSRLAKCYRDHYWLLMEDVRRKHRDFIWQFGKDFYEPEYDVVEGENENGVVIGDDVNNNNDNSSSRNGKLGLGFGGGKFNPCKFPNCGTKAMALTSYCHSHILSDSKQVLYIGCQFALKCSEDPILCGKPVLRSTVPSMCSKHMKIYEQNISRALRKSGAAPTASNKLAPRFHLLLAEYVRLIQTRRRARRVDNLATKDNAT